MTGKREPMNDKMHRDYPELLMGDKISYEKDGEIITETVTGWSYTSPQPEIVRQLSWRQKVVRRLTPARFRASLVVRPAAPAHIQITTDEGDPLQATLRTVKHMLALTKYLDE